MSRRPFHVPCFWSGATRSLWRAALPIALVTIMTGCAGPAADAALIGQARQTVLLSQFGDGDAGEARVHVLDGRDFSPISQLEAIAPATDVRPVPGGKRLLASQGLTRTEMGCCALYLLDLAEGTRCRLAEPLADYVASADGTLAFSQRGDTPITVYDLDTAEGIGQISADRNTFALKPSPDGHWLAAASGYSFSGKPKLRFIDIQDRATAGEAGLDIAAGAWLDGLYYGLSAADDGWHLLSIRAPDAEILSSQRLEDLGLSIPLGVPVVLRSAGDSLALHVHISDWTKVGGRTRMTKEVPGGVFVLKPSTGSKAAHLASDADIGELAVSEDGSTLYALVANRTAPSVLAIDVRSGRVEAELDLLTLGAGRWGLSATELHPSALEMRGDRTLSDCDVGA